MKLLKLFLVYLSLFGAFTTFAGQATLLEQKLDKQELSLLFDIVKLYEVLRGVEQEFVIDNVSSLPFSESLVKVIDLACESGCEEKVEVSDEMFFQLDGYYKEWRLKRAEWKSRHMYRFNKM